MERISFVRWCAAGTLVTLAIAVAGLVALLPLSSSEHHEIDEFADTYDPSGDLATVSILKQGVRTGLSYLLAATCIPLLLAALLVARRSGYLMLLPALGGFLSLAAAALLVQAFNNLGAWTEHGRVTVDEREYVFLDTSFLQGQVMVLGERQPDGLLYRKYRALVNNNGDQPRSWASIVRPVSAQNQYGQLYVAPGKILVGVRSGNQCYLAYDLANQKRLGHEVIEFISPFICIDPANPLLSTDVAATIRQIDERIAYCAGEIDIRPAEAFLAGKPTPGVPARATIEDALFDPDPAIAQAAQQILAAYQKGDAALSSKLNAAANKIPPTIFAPFHRTNSP